MAEIGEMWTIDDRAILERIDSARGKVFGWLAPRSYCGSACAGAERTFSVYGFDVDDSFFSDLGS